MICRWAGVKSVPDVERGFIIRMECGKPSKSGSIEQLYTFLNGGNVLDPDAE